MAEPEHSHMHNYAYSPSVANWVHSTTLATQFDGPSQDPPEPSPDEYYKSPFSQAEHTSAPPAEDMTTTRQRQQAPNGAVRPNPRPAFRSASGPATATSATRATPQLPVNRPTVRSLAQKFNQPSSAESSPSSARVRPARPTSSKPATASSSPARPAKEASYGPHKFNNLKPRERPQPAPASPASMRRVNGRRPSTENQASPSRRKLSSPTKNPAQPATPSRQPFFGEVVGEHDTSTPGFGIPLLESSATASEPGASPVAEKSTVKLVTDDPHLSPEPLFSGQSPVRHGRSPSEMTSQSADHSQSAPHTREPRRRSPPSRIPVASRRLSAASDSSSSNRSLKGGPARPSTGYKRTSPVRSHRSPATQRSLPIIHSKPPASAQPSSRYRDYRERGKSPKAGGNAHSLAAVITSPPQPKSPRLRNSRERQLLSHESADTRARTPEPHDSLDLNGDVVVNAAANPGVGQPLDQNDSTSMQREGIRIVHESDNPADVGMSSDQRAKEEVAPPVVAHNEPLTLHTSNLQAPQVPEPISATTDFEYEESPILGMPGSFMMTPPMAQVTPPMGSGQHTAHASPELLQPNTFQPLSKGPVAGLIASEDPENLPSELGIRESIPIMLGADEPQSGREPPNGRPLHSPRLSIGAHKWRAEPLDATGTISFLEEDDSPTDPFGNRDTLLPDDSASNVFYRHAQPEWTPKMPSLPSIPDARGLTLDSEAYSVINKVLNLYHRSPEISPEVAYDSRNKIQQVSPVVAQHNDWCSKESTETYLARLLSDANGSGEPSRENGYPVPEEQAHKDARNSVPDLSIQGLDDDPAEAHAGGTAIIYPPESRRYSRASSATTILDDASRAGSSSGKQAREHSPDNALSHQGHFHSQSHASNAQSQERRFSSTQGALYAQGDMVHSNNEQPGAAYNLLPEIATAGEGLGLSLQTSNLNQQHRQDQPPSRPAPLPPAQAGFTDALPTLPNSRFHAPSRRSALTHRSREPSQDHVHTIPSRPQVEMSQAPDTAFSFDTQNLMHAEATDPIHPAESIEPIQSDSKSIDDPHVTPTKTVKVVDSASSSTIAASEKYEHGVYPPLPNREDGTESKEIHPCALPGEDVEASTKRLQRRYRVLEEIAHTEHMFSSDMMVVSEIWLGTASEAFPDARDREKVFSNVAEISKFSYTLWQDLKGNIAPIVNQIEPPKPGEENPDEPYNEFENCTLDNDWDVAVGFVFKAYLPKIERLYTKYISNHDNANKIIAARVNEKDQAYLGWQHACYNHSKDITDAWDLDSLLVKPVQRLLKYPLLLDSLIAVTAPTHHDYDDLVYARKEIMEISNRINDSKKRAEAIREATKEGKREKKKGFRGIDIVKAFTGKTDKVKQQAGLADQWTDKEYDKQSQKFGGHFFQIQIILSDVDNYRDELTQCFLHLNILALSMVTLLESAPSSSPEIESAWRRNAMALLELRNVLLEDHKKAVRVRVWQPLHDLWSMYVKPETLMSKRKKLLPQYTRYHQALERKEKIDPRLEEAAQSFLAVNNALKEELPKMYDLTKKAVNAILKSFVRYQMDWWKNCQKKILPLLEYEPEHTTSFAYDMKAYVDRFHSDSQSVNAAMARLAICNGNLMNDIANFSSPLPSLYPDDASSRKSSSRRTESIGSDISTFDGHRHRRSGGYPASQRTMPSFDGPPGARPSMPSFEGPPRSAPHGYVQATPKPGPSSAPLVPRTYSGPIELPATRDDRAISPASDKSDITVTQGRGTRTRSYSSAHYMNMDGAFEEYDPPALASAYLSPTQSNPSSSRASAIFTSALPMSDSPVASRSAEELPGTPNDPDEPEVLFLAASLFEFNIAHDRREGGIPYLVYVPGEIFDVIGMKGELWLARNQDDPSKTVGWIWEKHFARILPEEM